MRSHHFSNTPIAYTNKIRITLSKRPYYKLDGTLQVDSSSSSWINHLGGNWRLFIIPRVAVLRNMSLLSCYTTWAAAFKCWPEQTMFFRMTDQKWTNGAVWWELSFTAVKGDTLKEIILNSSYRSPNCELNMSKLPPLPPPQKMKQANKQKRTLTKM